MKSPKCAIIIVNYNTTEDTLECLRSLSAHPPKCEYEIILADNSNSKFDWQPQKNLRVMKMAYNRGYGGAVNAAWRTTNASYALVLNPDILVMENAIDNLLKAAEDKLIGIAVPKLLNVDGSQQHSLRRFYSPSTLLAVRTPWKRWFPKGKTMRKYLMHDIDKTQRYNVDWAIGAAMLVPRRFVGDTKIFDERYFLYFEDVDLCARSHIAGLRVEYVPEASFVHAHRRSSAKNILGKTSRCHVKSLAHFWWKHKSLSPKRKTNK